MASVFSKQIVVLFILLLFFMETAAIKCYQQPAEIDENSMHKWIEKDCDNVYNQCMVATNCIIPKHGGAYCKASVCFIKKIFAKKFDIRDCASANANICEGLSMACEECRICERDLCNDGKIVAFSTMLLMLPAAIFVIFFPIMIG